MINYLNKRFDEASIVGVYAKVSLSEVELTEDEQVVLNAFRRDNPKYNDLNNEELGKFFSGLSNEELSGFVNNTKGVLHEMLFIEIENNDGDSIFAELYTSTTHPGYDVMMTNSETGEQWDVQLKTTDSKSYIQEWQQSNDGEILVSEEIAEKMKLDTTGISNKEVTVRTEEFIEKLQEMGEEDSIWNYIPALGIMSLSFIIFNLWKRYKKNEITYQMFKWLSIKSTGMKASKFTFLAALLSIPIISHITAVALLSNFLVSILITDK